MAKHKIKILFVQHADGLGGSSLSLLNIIKSIDKSKYEPAVLLLKESPQFQKLLKSEGVKYYNTESTFYRKYYGYFSHTASWVKFPYFWVLIKYCILWLLSRYIFSSIELRKIDYDIIHLNSINLTDWLYIPFRDNKIVIQHVREPLAKGYFGFRRGFFRLQINKYAKHVIAISKDNARRLNLPQKTTVVYNTTEIPNSIEQTKTDHSKKVLYLGGSSSIKGFYTVVDSLKYLAEDIKIIFAGNVNSNNYGLKNKIKKIVFRKIYKKFHNAIKILNTSNKVEIKGFVNNIKVLFDETMILISPFSKSHFSRPVIEAFAHCKPAIGSDVEGMDEIIDHKINGLIVEKNNPEKLAEAINQLCGNPKLCEKMGKAGYKKAKKIYTHDNVRKVEQIYNKLIKNEL